MWCFLNPPKCRGFFLLPKLKSLSKAVSQKTKVWCLLMHSGRELELSSNFCWVGKILYTDALTLHVFYPKCQNVHGFPGYSCTIIFKKSLIFCEFSHCINLFTLSILLCNNVVIGKRIYGKTAYCQVFQVGDKLINVFTILLARVTVLFKHANTGACLKMSVYSK